VKIALGRDDCDVRYDGTPLGLGKENIKVRNGASAVLAADVSCRLGQAIVTVKDYAAGLQRGFDEEIESACLDVTSFAQLVMSNTDSCCWGTG
jgi:hypothetical protein